MITKQQKQSRNHGNSKKLLVLIMYLFVVGFGFGQNLVPNPSFEDYISCPDSDGQIEKCLAWNSANMGTPDYYNECADAVGLGVPTNVAGYQQAHSGVGYVGICLRHINTNYSREYIQTELIETLQAGTEYTFRFYVSKLDNSIYSTNSIGILFSNTLINQQDAELVENNSITENVIDFFMDDTLNWVKVEGTYLAEGDEKFMTIGNFQNDDNTEMVVEDYGFIYQSLVIIDDVELLPSENMILEHNNNYVSFNQLEKLLMINSNIVFETEILDVMGSIIIKTTEQQISIKHFHNGIYFLIFRDEKGNVIAKSKILN